MDRQKQPKKMKPGNKSKPNNNSIPELLNNLQNDKRRKDSLELFVLMKEATKAEPVMWGPTIIGFGVHHYKYASGREGETVAVGFAPRKEALVLYGIVNDQDASSPEKLGPIKSGKGCLYIKDLSQINLSLLRELIDSAFRSRSND